MFRSPPKAEKLRPRGVNTLVAGRSAINFLPLPRFFILFFCPKIAKTTEKRRQIYPAFPSSLSIPTSAMPRATQQDTQAMQNAARSRRYAACEARANAPVMGARPSAEEPPSAGEQRGRKALRVAAVSGASASVENNRRVEKGNKGKLPVSVGYISFTTDLLTLPQRLTNASKVPAPVASGPIDFALSTKRVRGHDKRCEQALELTRKRLEGFLEEAPTFQLPWRLGDLDKQKEKPGLARQLEKLCKNDLGPGKPERCFSAKYVDLDGKPVCFYFGYRL